MYLTVNGMSFQWTFYRIGRPKATLVCIMFCFWKYILTQSSEETSSRIQETYQSINESRTQTLQVTAWSGPYKKFWALIGVWKGLSCKTNIKIMMFIKHPGSGMLQQSCFLSFRKVHAHDQSQWFSRIHSFGSISLCFPTMPKEMLARDKFTDLAGWEESQEIILPTILHWSRLKVSGHYPDVFIFTLRNRYPWVVMLCHTFRQISWYPAEIL